MEPEQNEKTWARVSDYNSELSFDEEVLQHQLADDPMDGIEHRPLSSNQF